MAIVKDVIIGGFVGEGVKTIQGAIIIRVDGGAFGKEGDEAIERHFIAIDRVMKNGDVGLNSLAESCVVLMLVIPSWWIGR